MFLRVCSCKCSKNCINLQIFGYNVRIILEVTFPRNCRRDQFSRSNVFLLKIIQFWKHSCIGRHASSWQVECFRILGCLRLCLEVRMFRVNCKFFVLSCFNRRMPVCNSALQTEKDLSQAEIRPNLPENCQISHFFVLQIPKNCLCRIRLTHLYSLSVIF